MKQTYIIFVSFLCCSDGFYTANHEAVGGVNSLTKKTRQQYVSFTRVQRKNPFESYPVKKDVLVGSTIKQSDFDTEIDVDAIIKYTSAAAVQMTCFSLLFFMADKASGFLLPDDTQIPGIVYGLFFYFISLQ